MVERPAGKRGRVPGGEIKRSREILEGRGGAGPSIVPRRDHEQGGGAGLSKLDLTESFASSCSLKLFINSGAKDIVFVSDSVRAQQLKQRQLRSAQVTVGQWPGDTALTPASIVLAAVNGLSGLFRAPFRGRAFTLSSPSHSVPVPTE